MASTVHIVQTDLGQSGEEELQKKVNLLTSELTTSKSEYDNIHSKWKVCMSSNSIYSNVPAC